MAIQKLFKSTIPAINYVFRDGTTAAFIGGRYTTKIEKHVEELLEQAASGHPHVYVDVKEPTVDTEAMTPLEMIKKQAIEEYLANQQKAMDAQNNVTKSDNSGGANTGALNSNVLSEASQNPATRLGIDTGKLTSLKVLNTGNQTPAPEGTVKEVLAGQDVSAAGAGAEVKQQ